MDNIQKFELTRKVRTVLFGRSTIVVAILLNLIVICFLVMKFMGYPLENPFDEFTVGNIDEKGPQRSAVIVVGDPQVIARETLINDRLREVDHIDGLLKKSSQQDFAPQVLRDVSVAKALAAQLGIAFGPVTGQASRDNNEGQFVRPEVQLLKLRNQLRELRAGGESGTAGQAEPGPSPDDTAGGADSSGTEIGARLDAVIQTVDDTLAELTTREPQQITARKVQLSSSPEERFEDENAYRARLRQRQTEVALDDAHDAEGNTLYRLQFTATVLPGEIKNKFGVLDFSIEKPTASEEEIEQLYGDWLVALMLRAFESARTSSSVEWEITQSRLIKDRLIQRIVLLSLQESGTDVSFFIHPDDDVAVLSAVQRSGQIVSLKDVKAEEEDTCNLAKKITRAQLSIRGIEVFTSILADRRWVDPEPIQALQNQFADAISAAERYQDGIRRICTEDSAQAPSGFFGAIGEENGDGLWTLSGEPYTYQAQPNQRVQRLSTLASAVNSMQSAFSLASVLAPKGLRLDAGAGASRSAIGTAEAIERTPLVIGYTNRDEKGIKFGFLFGPQAIIDPASNGIEYRQVAASYPVFADISVPAWWDHFDLKVRSAWAANWSDDEKILTEQAEQAKTRKIKVRLRPHRSGIDGLTRVIAANKAYRLGESAIIESIEPDAVSACEGDIQFVVKGRNLWRGASAYLRGRRHKVLAVLPDMEGVVVTFDMRSLPKPPDESQSARLLLWTHSGPAVAKDGKDGIAVEIENSRDGKPCN